MSNIQDLFISLDIVPIFDHTYNSDAKDELNKILLNPLGSVSEIIDRQQILKALLKEENLLVAFEYRKSDYVDTLHFLQHFSIEGLKEIDYLTFIFQKKNNDVLYGHYSQLIYFFKDIESAIKYNIDISKFPKSFQADLRFILNYLHSYSLTTLKTKIVKQKFGFNSIQHLNKLVLKKRNNGETVLFFAKLNLLEAYISICKSIPKLKLNFVEVGTTGFYIQEMFHPLLKDAVKNNFEIDNNIGLITGANMSGKSTFLKTIGLCVYLAHLGLPIPAVAGQIPFFEHIAIQINHSDDLKNGFSHFMNEIVNLKNVVEIAESGKRCFAIFDELFKGTNHEDALAISRTTLNGLQQFKNSLFFISTHLHELEMEIDRESIDAFFVDCIIDNGIPVFSYKIKRGWSDLKIGQLLFSKIGLHDMLNKKAIEKNSLL